LLALFYLRGRWLPAVAGPGTLISVMASLTFLMLLRQRLKKSPIANAGPAAP